MEIKGAKRDVAKITGKQEIISLYLTIDGRLQITSTSQFIRIEFNEGETIAIKRLINQ